LASLVRYLRKPTVLLT
ncbi:branched-chain amino acid transport system / permease component family protein, partial [Vibrio parahaemolyticus V-223/04]